MSMRRHHVASTQVRRHVPAGLRLKACQTVSRDSCIVYANRRESCQLTRFMYHIFISDSYCHDEI